MTIKKGIPETISQVPETNNKSTLDNTLSNDKKVSESSASGVTAIFDLNQRLYDDGLISKECYVEIEAVVANHMNCGEQKKYTPLCVQYTLNEIGAIEHGMMSLELQADLIYGNITQEHYDFMTATIPIDEQLKLGYIDQDFYNEVVVESWDEYEEDEQDVSMGFEDRDTIENVKDERLKDKLDPYNITTPHRMVLAFKKSVFSEVI